MVFGGCCIGDDLHVNDCECIGRVDKHNCVLECGVCSGRCVIGRMVDKKSVGV